MIRDTRKGYQSSSSHVLHGTASIGDGYLTGAAGSGTLKQLRISWDSLVAKATLEIKDGTTGDIREKLTLEATGPGHVSFFPAEHYDNGPRLTGLAGLAAGGHIHIKAIFTPE